MNRSSFLLIVISLIFTHYSIAQNAQITEELQTLKTYIYSDPDPVPILTSNSKIYPYFKYEGYAHQPIDKSWKIVKLENEYIEVYVLPEVGGKVWGAVDKSTGKEYIYRNEVMKFRNISMRGPWTSGGIEFNFGIIGHHPSTATPVDYTTQSHDDGSVSCTVGNIDLPSRTQWRVTISVHPEEAFFRTSATWYNPTEVEQAYYNWMTAAAFAQEDLVFYTPGNQYLKHSGEAMPWPMDMHGRSLDNYAENNFGPSKSYHVVGAYNDFFGGYFEKEDYGFGHLSAYDEIPGQKLWLWALSRSGGIWEDLLTDTDGQYIEFQAGRLFVQYGPESHVNPITQATFEPLITDQWEECWFPVNQIGGISDASEMAVLHVTHTENTLNLGVMGLQAGTSSITVKSQDREIFSEKISLEPLGVWNQRVELPQGQTFEVLIPELDITFHSHPELLQIDRPFQTPDDFDPGTLDAIASSGNEDVKFRNYVSAKKKYLRVVSKNPYHQGALLGLADLAYRSAVYDEALSLVKKVLVQDTYHAQANFIAGNIYWALNDQINALECYGWAARSMKYRSAAFAKMAQIYLSDQDYNQCIRYCEKSLYFNQSNVHTLQTQLLCAIVSKNNKVMDATLSKLKKVDPINHLAHWIDPTSSNAHVSELPEQSYLELALLFYNHNISEEALKILAEAPDSWLIELWKDKLDNGSFDDLGEITKLETGLVFPYRSETLHLLQEASRKSDHWKFDYWLGLNLQGHNRSSAAEEHFMRVGERADDPTFYLTRAALFGVGITKEKDLRRAYDLDPDSWRSVHNLITFYLEEDRLDEALNLSNQAIKKHEDNYVIEMDHIKVLSEKGHNTKAREMLMEINILPFEGASAGRKIYARVHKELAIEAVQQKQYEQAKAYLEDCRKWPENLGVGKPFNTDERLEDYLMGTISTKLNDHQSAQKYFDQVLDFTYTQLNHKAKYTLLAIDILRMKGQKDKAFALLNLLTDSLSNSQKDTYLSILEQMKNDPISGIKMLL